MYHSLIVNSQLAATIVFAIAVIYLLIGLISPSWAGAGGRGSVVVRSILGILFSIGLVVGVIAYTHMQPDGPHSIDTYIKNHDWSQYQSEKNDEGLKAPPAQ